MKKLTVQLLAVLFIAASIALAGSNAENNLYYHSGNKLMLTFSDDAVIEGNNFLTAEWPIGTGHEYLNSAFPIVLVASGGNQQVVAFESTASDGVAMSHRTETWPEAWGGQWNGYFGSGKLNADQESFYTLENATLGLRLTVRGWQWSHYLAQDVVILHYELSNIGTNTYDRAAMGFFVRPAVGGNGSDDSHQFDRSRAVLQTVDADNIGAGKGVAKDIGNWSPTGRFAVAVLETPGLATDGIDNDGDGMIDESRFDGIDNDNDWDPATDDVGADGMAGTNDEGENDGQPTAGEPNFDATDIDEADQIGLTSLAAFSSGGLNTGSANEMWSAFTPNRFDQADRAAEFVLGSSEFPLAPGETQRFSAAIFVSVNELDQLQNEEVIQQIYKANYNFPVAPPRPQVTTVTQNKSITLYWDNSAEDAADFEGYKIYRSTDPGFNDVFTVTNDRGVLIYSDPVAVYDLDNGIKDIFPLHVYGFRYFLGKDTGLKHWWTDTNVDNGKTYYYAVVAFDRGNAAQRIFPTESTKTIVIEQSGNILTDINTVVVTPTVESSGFKAPEYGITHTAGFATGEIEIELVDRTLIKTGGSYQITFDDANPLQATYSLFDITDADNPIPLFENSTNFSTEELCNDADPIFDGLHAFLYNAELAWDSTTTRWKTGNSNWSIFMSLNSNLGTATPVNADYEVRFGETGIDTAIFTSPIPVPFQVWNVTDSLNEYKKNILVMDQNGNGEWSSGEIIYIVEGETLQDFKPIYWSITLTAPTDSAVASIPPQSGDVAFLPTFKPFSATDVYTITTKAASVETSIKESALDEIAVVPNPYIISSTFEQRSLYTGGQYVRKLQFIHLPKLCTIRIFTFRGYLIKTIEHDNPIDNGAEFWDIRTDDNEVAAYGIYFYHIEAPGIGEKIGRFAIIR